MIADERTTALDATIQAEILGLIDRLRRENGVAELFITHDMAVVAQMADRVVVMHRGDVVEEASSPASPGAASRAATSPDATALVVGCTHAWFNRFRRLTSRHERRADIYAAFTSLAASLITLNPIRRFC